MSATIRLSDIFNASFGAFLHRYGPQPAEYYRAANAIMNCRTEKLGAHTYECGNCHEQEVHFHSCRNRHCPRCQGYASMQWVQDRMNELLPVCYFHAVFTVPAELNPFILRNKRICYAIMFRAVNDTLQQLAAQDKWLGALIGVIAVLHTWGQTLTDHPHLHCIIPAGGLRDDNTRWKHCRNNFLFPVAVVQKIYRGKFMEYFKEAIKKKEIEFHGVLKALEPPEKHAGIIDTLYRKEWVVYIKPPFVSPGHVLNYLGRYTHRVAISEKRIIAFKNGMVTFSYTDYAHGSERKTMTLTAVEFIRRFMLHILPKGFMRIRSFGLFANRGRTERIARCKRLLGVLHASFEEKVIPWWQSVLVRTGKNPLQCPRCKTGMLQLIMILRPCPGGGLS